MDIKMLEFGGWTPMADFAANREKIEFYNKNTGIVQKILERHAEDAKMGKDMVKNRVKQAKAKNIREQGPDHPDLKNYTENAGPNMQAMGAVKGLDKEQMKVSLRRRATSRPRRTSSTSTTSSRDWTSSRPF